MKEMKHMDSKAVAALRSAYWHREEAELALEAWAASGLSLAAFARRHQIEAKRLGRWRRRLAEGEVVEAPTPRFHRLRLVVDDGNAELSRVDDGVELVLRGGRRISVRSGFDSSTLQQLVQAVESWSC
jgi:hypothetical protein